MYHIIVVIMDKKKIIVIGGGLSGLTASYLLLKNGFDVTIIEKNANLGGFCTTYLKNDAYIDTCIHYLVGCKKSELTSLYNQLGFFDNNKIIHFPYFYRFHYFDKKIDILRDFNSFKKELESLSLKEDKKELDKFFKNIKSFYHFPIKTDKSMNRMNILDYINLLLKNFSGIKAYMKYKKVSIDEYASRFKTPIINNFIRSMMPNEVSIVPFLGLLSSFFKGNADTISFSSKEVIENIKKRILNLGGKIILNEEIINFNIADNKIASIKSNKNEYKGDYYISALPLTYLYSNLLKKEYQDEEKIQTLFDYKNNTPLSAFLVYYKIKPSYNSQISDYFIKYIPGGFKCITSTNKSIGFKYYSNIINKDNSHTLVCIIDQNYDDYLKWKSMKEDEYNKTKIEISNRIEKELLSLIPVLKDHIELVEVLTPKSLYEYTYNFGGCYMANLMSKTTNKNDYKYSSSKIKNIIYSSIWMTNLGGIPSALTSGEFAYKELLYKLKKD